MPVYKLMIDYLARPVSHEAFFKKYAAKKFLKGMARSDLTWRTITNDWVASILTRAWAKKQAIELRMDVSEKLA